ADRVIRHTVDADIRRKTANDRLGGHNGAGRPVSSWRWRLGPARFGSYRKRHRFASVSTAPAAFHASGLGRCDGRHRLLFEYPIIFWTPCAPMHCWTTSDVRWGDIMARAGPYRRGGGG